MKKIFVSLLAGTLFTGMTVTGAFAGTRQIQFAKGKSEATVSGKIKGNESIDYQLRAGAGQTMTIEFKASKGTDISTFCHPAAQARLFFMFKRWLSFSMNITQ